jgi:hypothetical protein
LPPETAAGPVDSQNTSGNAHHPIACYRRKTGGEVRFLPCLIAAIRLIGSLALPAPIAQKPTLTLQREACFLPNFVVCQTFLPTWEIVAATPPVR